MLSTREHNEYHANNNRLAPHATGPQPQRQAAPAIPAAMATPLGGMRVECEYVQGQVVGLNRQTETYHTTGRDHNGVYVSTYTQTRTEFHVERPDGTDAPYWHYWNIPLRNGQFVTNVHLRRGKRRVWAMMVNHTSGRWNYLWRGSQFPFELGALVRVHWWWMVLCMLPFLAVVFSLGSKEGGQVFAYGMYTSIGLYVVCKTVQWVRSVLMWRKMKPELVAIANRLLGKPSPGR